MGISEEIVKSLNLSLEDIKYDEQRKVILPSSDIVSKYAEKIVYPLDKVKGYIEKYFDIENIAMNLA